ncbi:MAG: C10 family peptidase [Bacteroidales bacterium]|nr:C10 family peptidase [Bacteroidales bacterium]
MRKTFSFFVLAIILTTAAFAQRVSQEQAATVCANFLADKGLDVSASRLKVAETYRQSGGEEAFYRFDIPGGGFAVVSASLTTPPVLAYSLKNRFETIPPVSQLFALYTAEIEQAEKNGWSAREKAAASWERLLNDDFVPGRAAGQSAGPLLTTEWDQGRFYNTYCPWDVNAGPYYDYRVPNGCVALACSQILNYHRYPESGVGITTYIPQGYPRQTVYFHRHKYNYDAMCDKPQSYANEIAKLAHHFGVAIQMNYNYDGSGAHTAQAKNKLTTVFKYDPTITSYFRDSYLDTFIYEYIEALKNEIDNRRVVYYSGCSQSGSCHAYVLDGYDEDDRFSLNYGWGGASNGFYAIDNFVAGPTHFDFSSEAVARIFPSAAAEPTYCSGHKRNTATFGYVADGSPTIKPYQMNPDCSWMVAAPTAYNYRFKFDRLDLAEGDYVTIYNGPTEESGVKVSLTGSSLPAETFEVAADSVLITFRGSAGNTEHYGFLISYSSQIAAPTCASSTTVADIWTTTLTDGSDDGSDYLPQSNCTWNVTHNFISGYAYAFHKFDLGIGDFVDIYDATTYPPTFNRRFDVENQPEGVYTVPFKRMQVKFISDNWDQKDGFALNYYAIAAVEDYNGLEDLKIYPNPASDKINVEFFIENDESTSVRLLDMTGKLLRNVETTASAGLNSIPVDVTGVASGIYLIEVHNTAGKSVRKVTVR